MLTRVMNPLQVTTASSGIIYVEKVSGCRTEANISIFSPLLRLFYFFHLHTGLELIRIHTI